MPFVIDASVALAWVFEDEVSEYADRTVARLRDEAGRAPAHWALEVANGLYAAKRRGRIAAGKIEDWVGLMLEMPITFVDVTREHALGPILALARAQGLSVYDAAYLDLAMREGLPLATLDDDLVQAAHATGVTTLT